MSRGARVDPPRERPRSRASEREVAEAASSIALVTPGGPTGLTVSAPRRFTPTYAAGLVAALGILLVTTGAWFVGALAALMSLLSGGSLLPIIAMGATSLLLGRGWFGLAQSVRARIRTHDLADVEALPAAVHSLSPQLQRLVRHTRTMRAALADPELDKPAVLRDMFEWVTAVAEITGEDHDTLVDRGLGAATLRARVVALHELADPRPRAVDLFDHFEAVLLDAGGDPFRGTTARRGR